MKLFKLGLILVILGFIVLFITPLLLVFYTTSSTGSEYAGATCILILFIPVCIGVGNTGNLPGILLIIAIILLIITLVLYLTPLIMIAKFKNSHQPVR